MDIDPANPYIKEITVPDNTPERNIRVILYASDGAELISYQPAEKQESPMPEVAKRPKSPQEIKTIEELYYAGLRLEQFYNPSLDPDPYYEEALRRDSFDYRVNTAVGIRYLKER